MLAFFEFGLLSSISYQISDAIVKDQKPHSSVIKEGLGFFTFQILDVNPLVNALAASGNSVATAGEKHGTNLIDFQ